MDSKCLSFKRSKQINSTRFSILYILVSAATRTWKKRGRANRIEYWNLFEMNAHEEFISIISGNEREDSFRFSLSVTRHKTTSKIAWKHAWITREDVQKQRCSFMITSSHPRHRSLPFELCDCFSYSGWILMTTLIPARTRHDGNGRAEWQLDPWPVKSEKEEKYFFVYIPSSISSDESSVDNFITDDVKELGCKFSNRFRVLRPIHIYASS